MKVLLQDKVTRRYFAGPHQWVEDRSEALDFKQVQGAAKAYAEAGLPYAEIVVDNGALPEPKPAAQHPPKRPGPEHRAHPRHKPDRHSPG